MRERLYARAPLFVRVFLYWFYRYIVRLGFLDGLPGLIHVSIGCMNSFMKYAKLIELRRNAP